MRSSFLYCTCKRRHGVAPCKCVERGESRRFPRTDGCSYFVDWNEPEMPTSTKPQTQFIRLCSVYRRYCHHVCVNCTYQQFPVALLNSIATCRNRRVSASFCENGASPVKSICAIEQSTSWPSVAYNAFSSLCKW